MMQPYITPAGHKELFNAKPHPDGTKMKLIFFARQNARNSSISCWDESKGSPPRRIQPGAHSRIEPAGKSPRNFSNDATDLNPIVPITKIYSWESSSEHKPIRGDILVEAATVYSLVRAHKAPPGATSQ